MINRFCWWLDSNPGPLVLEATAPPTVPRPLTACPCSSFVACKNCVDSSVLNTQQFFAFYLTRNRFLWIGKSFSTTDWANQWLIVLPVYWIGFFALIKPVPNCEVIWRKFHWNRLWLFYSDLNNYKNCKFWKICIEFSCCMLAALKAHKNGWID